ncbi:Uncharacterised protein [Achromobacter xylosoxidans]|nr:Uncharacterised protein [Achromobacter xylosoxidans]
MFQVIVIGASHDAALLHEGVRSGTGRPYQLDALDRPRARTAFVDHRDVGGAGRVASDNQFVRFTVITAQHRAEGDGASIARPIACLGIDLAGAVGARIEHQRATVIHVSRYRHAGPRSGCAQIVEQDDAAIIQLGNDLAVSAQVQLGAGPDRHVGSPRERVGHAGLERARADEGATSVGVVPRQSQRAVAVLGQFGRARNHPGIEGGIAAVEDHVAGDTGDAGEGDVPDHGPARAAIADEQFAAFERGAAGIGIFTGQHQGIVPLLEERADARNRS